MIDPVTASWTRLVRFVGVSAMLLSGTAGTVAAQIDTLALESHARFLAHDLLEGRHPASRGNRLAALYIIVTAEEQGLLGSNWFVNDPPLPLEDVHAVLILAGGMPPAPPARWGLVGAASPAGRTARGVVEARGLAVMEVGIGPQSDHWPFHLAGVPTLLLFPTQELEGLTGEQSEALHERWLHPHAPDDEWNPDFPSCGPPP